MREYIYLVRHGYVAFEPISEIRHLLATCLHSLATRLAPDRFEWHDIEHDCDDGRWLICIEH